MWLAANGFSLRGTHQRIKEGRHSEEGVIWSKGIVDWFPEVVTANCRGGLKSPPGLRLRECCKQVEAEVVSNSRNKAHQTGGPPFRPPLQSPCWCRQKADAEWVIIMTKWSHKSTVHWQNDLRHMLSTSCSYYSVMSSYELRSPLES